jgi:hypothetical protein
MAFDLVLKVGQSSTAAIVPLEADGAVTPGAVVTAQVYPSPTRAFPSSSTQMEPPPSPALAPRRAR